MQIHQIQLNGTLLPDGTLQFDQKPNMPPGPVSVVLWPTTNKTPAGESWWQCMQRVRSQQDAAALPLLGEAEMQAHLEWLREDGHIEEIYRQTNHERDHRESQ